MILQDQLDYGIAIGWKIWLEVSGLQVYYWDRIYKFLDLAPNRNVAGFVLATKEYLKQLI